MEGGLRCLFRQGRLHVFCLKRCLCFLFFVVLLVSDAAGHSEPQHSPVNGALVLGEVVVCRKEEGSLVVGREDAWGAFWEYAVFVAALHYAVPVHVEEGLALVNGLVPHAYVIKEIPLPLSIGTY